MDFCSLKSFFSCLNPHISSVSAGIQNYFYPLWGSFFSKIDLAEAGLIKHQLEWAKHSIEIAVRYSGGRLVEFASGPDQTLRKLCDVSMFLVVPSP
jgi:hypothetical protein